MQPNPNTKQMQIWRIKATQPFCFLFDWSHRLWYNRFYYHDGALMSGFVGFGKPEQMQSD